MAVPHRFLVVDDIGTPGAERARRLFEEAEQRAGRPVCLPSVRGTLDSEEVIGQYFPDAPDSEQRLLVQAAESLRRTADTKVDERAVTAYAAPVVCAAGERGGDDDEVAASTSDSDSDATDDGRTDQHTTHDSAVRRQQLRKDLDAMVLEKLGDLLSQVDPRVASKIRAWLLGRHAWQDNSTYSLGSIAFASEHHKRNAHWFEHLNERCKHRVLIWRTEGPRRNSWDKVGTAKLVRQLIAAENQLWRCNFIVTWQTESWWRRGGDIAVGVLDSDTDFEAADAVALLLEDMDYRCDDVTESAEREDSHAGSAWHKY